MSINENSKPKTPEKSNFTRRCSLLSRYLKEKGSFGNIDLELVRRPDSDLRLPGRSDLPGKQNEIEKAEDSKVELCNSSRGEILSESSDPKSSQLTIFFGGKVMVYNEFPSDKAKEIMEVAKQAKAKIQTQINVENKSKIMVLPDLNEPTNSADTSDNKKQQQEQNQVVERIARRASLHRFFAKRKDRAVARAPYQVNQNVGYLRYPPKTENVAGPGQSLEPGQSSQRPDKAIARTVAKTESDFDKDTIAMETEEGQCSKDLDLRL